MKTSNNNNVGDIAAVLLLLFLSLGLLLINSQPSAANINPLDRAVRSMVAWLQQSATGGSDSTSSFLSNLREVSQLVEENKTLKERVITLEAENAKLSLADRELTRMKELLDFRQTKGLAYLPAKIISRETTPSFRVIKLRIDRGEDEKKYGIELKKGMAVVSAQGVVGQLSRVYGDYADLILLSDPQSRIDAMIERNRSSGTLIGKGEDDGHLCSIPFLSRDDTVSEGDTIVTSGLDKMFPKGLPIGVVTKVTQRKEQPFQEVEVQPGVNFEKLEYVFVVTYLAAPQSIPSAPAGLP
jgi:rod shape-determining protein MreC